ncbi:30S ribosomal protein S12 methylthiotransferase RimO [Chitinivibrio alkaliphilus]|uniref:Ribosomal protein uS12 methylthiotransferase RimO n=1 Tax=Chitinivibrio alkaliphilus ACht1 TaxID=1313304 RepID=U7D9X7_9BACT|nr:30S ribosomal protein S12 methylthiotransferase RimO [Chitinivibrio alkaliphilus]ERP31897.1 30S ribosomal protein S12 methylthiotransferase [Chitinivibrio alkaliphilus ACht1]
MKIALFNLGCSKNIVDGNKMLGFLQEQGCTVVDDAAAAEVLLVNTCTFIESATKEAIDTIFAAAGVAHEEHKTLIVAGCFSQRYREEIAQEFPEVDLWLGVDDWEEGLRNYFSLHRPVSGYTRRLEEPLHSQYLKISEGCSHRCSFCIIPHIRGSFRSFSPDDLLAEAKWLESQGVRECIVVSQDTSFYGRDHHSSLAVFLERLVRETSFPMIRMMYLHPAFVDADLLALVAREERLCSYFDIPLQHISDSILSQMGRRPGEAGIYEVIQKIRDTVPDAVIRSSFILGYPGETEEDFEKLCDFIRWARLDKVGVFPYSPEEGTRAAEAEPKVPVEVAQERCEILMNIQRDISREKQEERVGKTLPVLIDRISDSPDYLFEGRTMGDAPEVDGRVFILSGDGEVGQIVPATIIDCDDYDLFATL